MQSIKIQVVFLFLFVISCSVRGLRNCGEIGKNEIIDYVLKEDSKPLPYQHVLDQLFDAFDGNDSLRMEEMYKLLENVETYESDDSESQQYATTPVRHVVSFRLNYTENMHPKQKHEINAVKFTSKHIFLARSN